MFKFLGRVGCKLGIKNIAVEQLPGYCYLLKNLLLASIPLHVIITQDGLKVAGFMGCLATNLSKHAALPGPR